MVSLITSATQTAPIKGNLAPTHARTNTPIDTPNTLVFGKETRLDDGQPRRDPEKTDVPMPDNPRKPFQWYNPLHWFGAIVNSTYQLTMWAVVKPVKRLLGKKQKHTPVDYAPTTPAEEADYRTFSINKYSRQNTVTDTLSLHALSYAFFVNKKQHILPETVAYRMRQLLDDVAQKGTDALSKQQRERLEQSVRTVALSQKVMDALHNKDRQAMVTPGGEVTPVGAALFLITQDIPFLLYDLTGRFDKDRRLLERRLAWQYRRIWMVDAALPEKIRKNDPLGPHFFFYKHQVPKF